MVKPRTVVYWIKYMGGIYKKERKLPLYHCKLGNVEIEIDEKEVKVSPIVEESGGYLKYENGKDYLDAVLDLENELGVKFSIEEPSYCKDWRMWFIFPIDEYKKALKLAELFDKEDVWVKINCEPCYFSFRKDEEIFHSPREFAKWIKGELRI